MFSLEKLQLEMSDSSSGKISNRCLDIWAFDMGLGVIDCMSVAEAMSVNEVIQKERNS